VTGRPQILPEIGRNLAGGVTSLSINPKRDDIVTYLRSRLAADTTPDAGDSNLEVEILEKMPSDISEMYVGQQHSESYLKLSTNRHIHRFLLVSLNIQPLDKSVRDTLFQIVIIPRQSATEHARVLSPPSSAIPFLHSKNSQTQLLSLPII